MLVFTLLLTLLSSYLNNMANFGLLKTLKNPDVIIVDPLEEFYNHERNVHFVFDRIHYTEKGNDVIANEIMNSIRNLLN